MLKFSESPLSQAGTLLLSVVVLVIIVAAYIVNDGTSKLIISFYTLFILFYSCLGASSIINLRRIERKLKS